MYYSEYWLANVVEMLPQSTRAPRKWTPAENSLLQLKVEECSKGRMRNNTSGIQTDVLSQRVLVSQYIGQKLPQTFETEARTTAANGGRKWTKSGERVHGTVVKMRFSVKRSKNTAAGGQTLSLFIEVKC